MDLVSAPHKEIDFDRRAETWPSSHWKLANVPAMAVALVLLVGWAGVAGAAGRAHRSAPTPLNVSAVAAKVDPGLVDVNTTLTYETATGAGTGMVISSTGEVLTNNHVVEGETSLHVTDLGNGKTYVATVVGYDVGADVAVLQMVGASHLHTVSFATALPKVKQAVVAIGNAGGKGGKPTAVSGTVTGLGQSVTAEDGLSGTVEHLTGLIEINAPIQAGDSGGPLVNATGKVLGMDTAGSSSFGFARETTQGFSIPIWTVRTTGSNIEHQKASSPIIHVGPTALLGVEVTNIDTAGAVILGVLEGTGATSIGLGRGDTIVSLDGRPIQNPTGLSVVLQPLKPGATIKIGWSTRFGASYTATVTLTSGPPA